MTSAARSDSANRPPFHRVRPSPMPWPTPSACACRRFQSRRSACSPLWKRKEAAVDSFEYASPTTLEQAFGLLDKTWGQTEVLAGGSDLLALMKDYIITPKRLVNIKGIKELERIK